MARVRKTSIWMDIRKPMQNSKLKWLFKNEDIRIAMCFLASFYASPLVLLSFGSTGTTSEILSVCFLGPKNKFVRRLSPTSRSFIVNPIIIQPTIDPRLLTARHLRLLSCSLRWSLQPNSDSSVSKTLGKTPRMSPESKKYRDSTLLGSSIFRY